MNLDFRLLGSLAVTVDGRDTTPPRPKQRALLALLVLRAGEVVASDELVEALWAGRPPPTAHSALHGHVAALRRLLGQEAIETRPPGYRLTVAPEQTDLGRFLALLDQARGEPQAAPRAELLREALGLFRGEPLADFRYEAFAKDDAARLEDLRLAAREEHAEAELELGRHRELVPELERLLASHPLRERIRGLLMLALYRSNRQADALDAYRAGRRLMVDELGLEPGAELRDLERAILAQDPALVPPVAPAASTPHSRPPSPGNLPTPSTPFVGRERELAELAELLAGERLVTVHGAGGSGKTRLALRAAEDAADRFEHGAWLVELAEVTDPELVWDAVAAALDVTQEPARALGDSVLDAVAGRRLLLVLDNCEHLVDVAREVTVALQAAGPGIRVLATSREPLGDPAERVWPIPELSIPGEDVVDPEAMLAHDAVRLFAARGARALPGYHLDERDAPAVARICRSLDGMPLAIELSAARLSVLSVGQIEERLADRFRLLTRGARAAPERHRTLRAVVVWSYDLLDDAERAALARVSVFAGGFDVDAAERVLPGDELAEVDVLDLLEGLVAKSLVQRHDEHGRARFGLHETIRDYAAERLLETGDLDRVAERHLDAYLDLMIHADDELRGPEQSAWAHRLAPEQDNFRRALSWGLSHGHEQQALDLAWLLNPLWMLQGSFEESGRWLGEALARTAGAPPSVDRARALSRWGELAERAGDYEAARARYAEAVEMGRTVGDPVREGVALLALGEIDLAQGRLDEARHRFDAASELMRAGGDRERARWPVDALGRLALAAGEPARARGLFETSRAEARALGNEAGVGESALLLGRVAHHEGDHAAARGLYEESLGLARRLGDRQTEAEALLSVGQLAVDAGAADEAAGPLTDALRFMDDAGLRPSVPACLDALAAMAGPEDPDTAARLLGAASAFREILGTVAGGPDLTRRERALASAREALGDPDFAIAHGGGRSMGWRDAVDRALRLSRS